jgi:hypothetical protein
VYEVDDDKKVRVTSHRMLLGPDGDRDAGFKEVAVPRA